MSTAVSKPPAVLRRTLWTQVRLRGRGKEGVHRFVQVLRRVMGSLPKIVRHSFTRHRHSLPTAHTRHQKPRRSTWSGARHVGLDTVITRSAIITPRQFPRVFAVLLRMPRDETIPLYGDGRNVRDWIFVEIIAAQFSGAERWLPGAITTWSPQRTTQHRGGGSVLEAPGQARAP